jgi:hypothetical protein
MSDADPIILDVIDDEPPVAVAVFGQGVYRKGDLLVVHKAASLPDRCVKSNEPANGRTLMRNLTWYPPVVVFTGLVSPIIFVALMAFTQARGMDAVIAVQAIVIVGCMVIALIMRKKATIDIGLSELWFHKRRWAMAIAWISFLTADGLILLGVGGGDQVPGLWAAVPVGLVIGLVGTTYGILAARLVRACRITDEYIWLKGAHPEFLDSLPEYPYDA